MPRYPTFILINVSLLFVPGGVETETHLAVALNNVLRFADLLSVYLITGFKTQLLKKSFFL